MDEIEPFVDIHCHLIPDIDDGAKSWDESLAMAQMAVADGTSTAICTPHQLGSYAHNGGAYIQSRTLELQRFLLRHGVPLQVLPGADVRLEPDLVLRVQRGEVLSLGDRRKHVLLELPPGGQAPLLDLIDTMAQHGLTAVVSHPDRNQGLLREPRGVQALVDRGCLMQVTADSILGTFGSRCQEFVEQLLADGNLHFVATDAHGQRSRRPLLRRAFERVRQLAGTETAVDLFCRNPRCVADGREVVVRPQKQRRSVLPAWLGRRRAG